MRTKSIRTVEVSGSFSRMGVSVGRQCKDIAASLLKESRSRFRSRGFDWLAAVDAASAHKSFMSDYDPDFFEYMVGYARGSGQRFEDVMVLFCEGEKGLCTDIAVNGLATADGGVYALHNEDWRPVDERHTVLLRAHPKGAPAILAVTLGGFEFDSGINSSGLGFSFNSLEQNDMRVGVPKTFMGMRIAKSRTIGEGIAAATVEDRASSYNVNLSHSSGEMYCVEGSATDYALLYPHDGFLVHTNHYLDSRMTRYEALMGPEGNISLSEAGSTLPRFHRALRLVRGKLGDISPDDLFDIARDHVNRPGSICRHLDRGKKPDDQWKTIYSSVADLSKRRLHVCQGSPCDGRFVEHRL